MSGARRRRALPRRDPDHASVVAVQSRPHCYRWPRVGHRSAAGSFAGGLLSPSSARAHNPAGSAVHRRLGRRRALTRSRCRHRRVAGAAGRAPSLGRQLHGRMNEPSPRPDAHGVPARLCRLRISERESGRSPSRTVAGCRSSNLSSGFGCGCVDGAWGFAARRSLRGRCGACDTRGDRHRAGQRAGQRRPGPHDTHPRSIAPDPLRRIVRRRPRRRCTPLRASGMAAVAGVACGGTVEAAASARRSLQRGCPIERTDRGGRRDRGDRRQPERVAVALADSAAGSIHRLIRAVRSITPGTRTHREGVSCSSEDCPSGEMTLVSTRLRGAAVMSHGPSVEPTACWHGGQLRRPSFLTPQARPASLRQRDRDTMPMPPPVRLGPSSMTPEGVPAPNVPSCRPAFVATDQSRTAPSSGGQMGAAVRRAGIHPPDPDDHTTSPCRWRTLDTSSPIPRRLFVSTNVVEHRRPSAVSVWPQAAGRIRGTCRR